MSALVKSNFQGEVVWLGHVPAGGSLRAGAVDHLDLGFEGITGGRHEGVNRGACIRVKNLYPTGTQIRNVRQLTILSVEELDTIAKGMGLEQLDPELLGASIVLRGIPDFSHIPPSARLQGPTGVTLTVDLENRPCVLVGREIESKQPGYGAAFKPAAANRRGVTAWVERPGKVSIGDQLTLFIPDQSAWQP